MALPRASSPTRPFAQLGPQPLRGPHRPRAGSTTSHPPQGASLTRPHPPDSKKFGERRPPYPRGPSESRQEGPRPSARRQDRPRPSSPCHVASGRTSGRRSGQFGPTMPHAHTLGRTCPGRRISCMARGLSHAGGIEGGVFRAHTAEAHSDTPRLMAAGRIGPTWAKPLKPSQAPCRYSGRLLSPRRQTSPAWCCAGRRKLLRTKAVLPYGSGMVLAGE